MAECPEIVLSKGGKLKNNSRQISLVFNNFWPRKKQGRKSLSNQLIYVLLVEAR
jgi:hypothetical protein